MVLEGGQGFGDSDGHMSCVSVRERQTVRIKRMRETEKELSQMDRLKRERRGARRNRVFEGDRGTDPGGAFHRELGGGFVGRQSFEEWLEEAGLDEGVTVWGRTAEGVRQLRGPGVEEDEG